MQNFKKKYNYSIEGWVALRGICIVLMLSVMMPTWANGSFSSNIKDIAKGWWGSLWSHDTEATAQVNAASRGGKLTMPLLDKQSNRLLVGKDKLFLGWKGGEAPFSVTVKKGGESLPPSSNINENFTSLSVDLKEGDYSVTVIGVTGEFTGEFTVVKSLPPSLGGIESELGINKNPKTEEDKLWYAMGLSEYGWKFEAYQWIAGIDRKKMIASINKNKKENEKKVVDVPRVWKTKLVLETGHTMPPLTK